MLDKVFSPLSGFNVESLYHRYQAAVDFVLYAAILIFACRTALSRMYPDQYGKSLGTVLGVILAIALSTVADRIGFNIKAFGPIAAGIIILMVSLVLYNLMRQSGTGHLASGSIALIVTYFSLRAVMPGFFLWAEQNQWAGYLHSILFLAVLVSIGKVAKSLFGTNTLSSLKSSVRNNPFGKSEFIKSYEKEEVSEIGFVKKKLERLTIQGKRECMKVIRILEQVIEIVQQHGRERQVIEPACKVLNNILAREHVLKSNIAKIRSANESLTGFNLSGYDDLLKKYEALDKKQKSKLGRLFAEERDKTGVTEAIRGISLSAENHLKEADRSIRGACQSLVNGRSGETLSLLRRAIALETAISGLLGDLKKQEKMLIRSLRRHLARLEASK